MGTLCFGDGVNGEVGYDEEDILYIGFIGGGAVPGTAAKWTADNETDFEASIRSLGDKLIEQIEA